MITIPAKSKHPITEHKVDILERLDPSIKIGRGGSECKINKKLPKLNIKYQITL
jgi:hypothetical protein